MDNTLMLCTAFTEDEDGTDVIYIGDKIIYGKWIDGYYVCLNATEHRIYTGYAEVDCGDYYPDCYTVIADTVSRFTGLFDVNNNPIFQMDVIKIDYDDSSSITGFVDFQNGSYGVLVMKESNNEFYPFCNFKNARIERHGHSFINYNK